MTDTPTAYEIGETLQRGRFGAMLRRRKVGRDMRIGLLLNGAPVQRNGGSMSNTFFRSLLVLVLILFAVEVQPQSTRTATSGATVQGQRYQYISDAPVEKVLDTYNGRVYVWFPRNEAEKTEPYIAVRDSVAGTFTQVAIKLVPAGR